MFIKVYFRSLHICSNDAAGMILPSRSAPVDWTSTSSGLSPRCAPAPCFFVL